MSNKPTIMIVTQEHAAGMSAVLDAQGRGPDNFTNGRAVVSAGTTSPVIARLIQDGSADDVVASGWAAMQSDSTLPTIIGTWGANGVISSADAQIAMGGILVVESVDNIPSDWAASVLAGHNYAFEPDPEF
jgi:hypothetical protein